MSCKWLKAWLGGLRASVEVLRFRMEVPVSACSPTSLLRLAAWSHVGILRIYLSQNLTSEGQLRLLQPLFGRQHNTEIPVLERSDTRRHQGEKWFVGKFSVIGVAVLKEELIQDFSGRKHPCVFHEVSTTLTQKYAKDYAGKYALVNQIKVERQMSKLNLIIS